MIQLVSQLLQLETLLTLFVAVAAFGTVVSVASPFFEGDKLKDRMKNVTEERERLRAQQRAGFATAAEGRAARGAVGGASRRAAR